MDCLDQNTLNCLHNIEVETLLEIDRICRKHNLKYFLIAGTLLGAIRHKGFIPWDDDLDIGMPREDYEKFQKICEQELGDDFFLDTYKTNKNYWLPFGKIRKNGTIYRQGEQSNILNGHEGVWVDIFPLDNANKVYGRFELAQAKTINILRSAARRNITKISDEKKFIVKLLSFIPGNKLLSWADRLMQLNKNKNSPYYVSLGSPYGIKKETMPKEKYEPPIELTFEGYSFYAPCDYDYVLNRLYKNYMELPPLEQRVTHNPQYIDLGEFAYKKEG